MVGYRYIPLCAKIKTQTVRRYNNFCATNQSESPGIQLIIFYKNPFLFNRRSTNKPKGFFIRVAYTMNIPIQQRWLWIKKATGKFCAFFKIFPIFISFFGQCILFYEDAILQTNLFGTMRNEQDWILVNDILAQPCR